MTFLCKFLWNKREQLIIFERFCPFYLVKNWGRKPWSRLQIFFLLKLLTLLPYYLQLQLQKEP